MRQGNCKRCRCVLVCGGVQSVDTCILFFLQVKAAGCNVFARPHLFSNTTVIILRRYNTRGEGRNMTVKQGSVAAEGVKGNCCFCCDGQCAVCPAPQYAGFCIWGANCTPRRAVQLFVLCPCSLNDLRLFALILRSTNYSCLGLIKPNLKHVQNGSHWH